MNKHSPSYNLVSLISLASMLLVLSGCGSDDDTSETKLAKLASAGALSTAIHSSTASEAPPPSARVEPSAVTPTPAAVNTPASSGSVSPMTSSRSSAAVSSSRSSASVSSSSALVNTKDSTAPTAPASVKQAKLLSQSVTISWVAATDNKAVTAYRVYRNGTQVAQLGGNTFTFTDTKLQADTSYSYTLRAGDAEGNWSPVSSALKLKTLTVSGDVTVEWFVPTSRENGEYLEVAEIGGYEIRYKLPSQKQYTSVFVKSGEADQCELGYLEGDYEFQIATYDINGLYSEFVAIKPN